MSEKSSLYTRLDEPRTLTCMEPRDRPRERLQSLGAGALSDRELLALILHAGSAQRGVMEVAAHVLQRAGTLGGLLRLERPELLEIRGIGPVKAGQILAIVELARRLRLVATDARLRLLDPADIVGYMRPQTLGLLVEKLWVLALDRRARLLHWEAVTTGTANQTLASPREILRCALRHGAATLVCVHNHPAGDPAPSAQDIGATRCLRDAAKVVDLQLVDHIIIGEPGADPLGKGYYSFAESGLI